MLEPNAYEERMPSWSADGSAIYFNSNRCGAVAIWRRSLKDGSVKRISADGMFAVSASPHDVVYSSRTGQLWQDSLSGGNAASLQQLVPPEPVMSWFVLNRIIYTTRFDSQTHHYSLWQYDGKRSKLLANNLGPLVQNAPDIAVSPDSRWLLYARQDSAQSDLKIRHSLQ
jgi:hypothetical protein